MFTNSEDVQYHTSKWILSRYINITCYKSALYKVMFFLYYLINLLQSAHRYMNLPVYRFIFSAPNYLINLLQSDHRYMNLPAYRFIFSAPNYLIIFLQSGHRYMNLPAYRFIFSAPSSYSSTTGIRIYPYTDLYFLLQPPTVRPQVYEFTRIQITHCF
jgi:hypothetical protein